MSARTTIRGWPPVAWFLTLLYPAQLGLVVGVVAFVPVRIGFTSTVTINGKTSCSYVDFIAFVVSGICFWAAGSTFLASRKSWNAERKGTFTVISVILLVFAVLHALRGAGVLLSPC